MLSKPKLSQSAPYSNAQDREGAPRKAIAIIGLSGRYPGAKTLDNLWHNLRSGIDAVTEADGSRWDLGFHAKDSNHPNRIYTRSGGFLDNISDFDAEFFGMSPREARQVDPQHRLLLELCWEAFEGAGLVPSSLSGSRTGVFIGISNNDYSTLAGQDTVDAYTNIGSALSIAANRISYVFDLHGPSMAIDTACSSSMVAMHQACMSLASGDCDMAVAGGVNILASMKPWLGFAQASMLSPDGRCKSFDASGNGYVRAEGGGIVLLKPLDAAERDGDSILGVVLGTGVNSDGKTMGMALPSGEAQERLLNELYSQTGVTADDVFYVEAHGTGTAVGDPIECGAIGRVLGAPRASETPCYIGSIKSNIGHLEPAAGIAGLTKLLLALRHREIPANLHFTTPNPKIEFDNWKLKVVNTPIALPDQGSPLIFGINSFGFGGTNAHMILQEYVPPAGAQASKPRLEQDILGEESLLILSGHTPQALDCVVADFAAHLSEPQTVDWPTVCATQAHHRTLHAHRLVVAASDAHEASTRLTHHRNGEKVAAISLGRASAKSERLALVFSGNGPQWWGMGRELLAENRMFKDQIGAIDAIFAPLAGWSLIEEMRGPESETRIALTEVAQPMLFAQQIAITAVLKAAGIVPDVVFGHSVGEAAAAYVSGALSLEQATTVIFHRSQMQAQTRGRGRMAAIGLGVEDIRREIIEVGGWLEVAAINAPRAVTVGGELAALERLGDRLTDQGHFVRTLPLDYAFHTQAMDAIKAPLLLRLEGLTAADSQIPFISTVRGTTIEGSQLNGQYWWDNVREPVQFESAVIDAINSHNISAFLEVGPHPVLKDYIQQTVKSLPGATAVALTSLRRPQANRPAPETATLKAAIGAAFAAGVGDVNALFARPSVRAELPAYPWQKASFWRGGWELPESVHALKRDHPLLGRRLPTGDGIWTNTIQPVLLPFLKDHVVQGAPLFPAAGYIEQVLAAGGLLLGDGPLDLEGFEIQRPLVLPDGIEPLMQVKIDNADGTAVVSARPSTDQAEWMEHAKGRVTRVAPDGVNHTLDLASLRATMPVQVTAQAHYIACDRRSLTYGPAFQGVKTIWMTPPDATQRGAIGEIELSEHDVTDIENYRAHPAVVDSCLQVLISLIGQNDPRDCATIPIQVGRVRSLAPLPAKVYCHVALERESPRSGVATFSICDPDGRVLLSLETARFQKVEFRSAALPLISEDWQIDADWVSARRQTIDLPDIATLTDVIISHDVGEADAVFKGRMDQVVGRFAARALDVIRAGREEFTVDALMAEGKVSPNQKGLLARLMAMAQEDGILTDGPQWRWVAKDTLIKPDVETLWRDMMLDYPEHVCELMAVNRAGEDLVARLRDEVDYDVAMAEGLEDRSPWRAGLNKAVADTVRHLVDKWPKGRRIRVLEAGGATGGLTTALMDTLPPQGSDYLFTDTSAAAVGRAKSRFAQHPSFSACPVQLTPSQDSGLRGTFDLVIINSADYLNATLPHLSPGGIALIVNRCRSRFADLVFAADYAGKEFVEHLTTLGCDIAALTDEAARESLNHEIWAAKLNERPAMTLVPSETPMTASAEDEVRRTVIVTADARETPYVHGLMAALGQGQPTPKLHVLFPQDMDEAGLNTVIALHEDTDEFVYLVGRAPADDPTAGCDTTAQVAVLIANAIETHPIRHPDSDLAAKLTLVSHGGMASPIGSGAIAPFQATIAGLARVMANEMSSLGVRLIDVHADPEDRDAGVDLARALIARDAETEVLLTEGHRFINRVRFSSIAEQVRLSKPSAPSAPTLDATPFRLDFLPQGGLDSLHLREMARRAPNPGEIEIEVRAAGLNFRDVLWAMGMLPEDAVEHGFSGATIGMECAGQVTRVGEGVASFKPGDRVIAFASSCFASHVTTRADCAAIMPDTLSFAAGATLPTTFVTAWYALDYLARLEPGESVLIHGAAGGVGLAALQIAKLKGAKVFATAGSADKQRLLRKMGADYVMSSRSLNFADEIMSITSGQGIDIVLNSLAGEAITKGLQILKPFGRFLEIGKRDLYANSRIGLRPFRQNLSYFGIDADTLLVEKPALAKRMFDAVISAIDQGALRPLPHQSTPISRASEAFRAMQSSRHVGKLVVTIDDQAQQALTIVPSARLTLRPDATYVVTGGLGGFGLETAHWLVANGARSLALMGRRGDATEEAQAGLSALRQSGAAVTAFATDVSDSVQLAAAFAAIRRDMPPIKGVIHAAAVIEDAPLINVNQDLMRKVMGAKAIGAWNLHTATLEDALDIFVMYASSSAVVGNPGQGAYVAANMVLNALATYRRARGLPALSVGWGAIKDAGFLTRHAEVGEMLAQRSGMEATPARVALDELGRLIQSGATCVAAAQFNLMRLGQNLTGARTPRFAKLLPEGVSMAVDGAGSIASVLEGLDEDERRVLILARVREHVSRVVGSSADQIDPERALSDLGLDSLMAVELAESLEADIGKPVSVMQMIQAATVNGVVETVMRGFRKNRHAEASADKAEVDKAA